MELMFARKIKTGFYKILHERKAQTSRNIPIHKYLNPGEKVLLNAKKEKNYRVFKCGTKTEKIDSRIDSRRSQFNKRGVM